jgi:hypothetical protein
MLLQSAKPGAHIRMPQVPPSHLGTAFANRQMVSQSPQCAVSLAMSISQPSSESRLQSSKPLPHSNEHLPSAQVPMPCGALSHFLPHLPQFSGSTATSLQVPAQHRLSPQSASQVEIPPVPPPPPVLPPAPP